MIGIEGREFGMIPHPRRRRSGSSTRLVRSRFWVPPLLAAILGCSPERPEDVGSERNREEVSGLRTKPGKKTVEPDPAWEARLTALRKVLGRGDDRILTSPLPFHLGGQADVLTFRKDFEGARYVTAGLIGDDQAKPNSIGQYELMICLEKPDDWAPKLLSKLSIYAKEAVLAPRDTMEIAPALPQPTTISHFLFVDYARIDVGRKPCMILLCLGITAQEYEYLQKNGYTKAIEALKRGKVYPYTDLRRESVVQGD